MSRLISLLIMTLIVSLWRCNIYAQEKIISVEELFELVDRNSKSIQISKSVIDQAAEAVNVARANRLPSLDAALSFSYLGDAWISDRDFSNGTNASMPHLGNNFSLEATQVVYGGSAIRAGVQSAELQQQIAELSLQDNRQNIRFLMLGYYLELYKLKNQYAVYLKNIDQTKMLLQHIKARHIEGLALNNDVTRYELQLQQLELALTEVKNNSSIVNFQLVSTLGLPPETIIIPDTALLRTEVLVLDKSEWQQKAQLSQAHLKIADLSISLSKQQERITRSERLPKVALIAANHFDGPIVIEVPPINKNFNYWYVGIGIQYNFGSLWKSKQKSRMNKYATIQAQQRLDLAQEETEIAVNSAYIMLQQAYEQLHTQEKSVELAEQNYHVINNRYLNDLALITDMLDASNSQLSAELMLVNARINIVYNYYKLQRVSGIL